MTQSRNIREGRYMGRIRGQYLRGGSGMVNDLKSQIFGTKKPNCLLADFRRSGKILKALGGKAELVERDPLETEGTIGMDDEL